MKLPFVSLRKTVKSTLKENSSGFYGFITGYVRKMYGQEMLFVPFFFSTLYWFFDINGLIKQDQSNTPAIAIMALLTVLERLYYYKQERVEVLEKELKELEKYKKQALMNNKKHRNLINKEKIREEYFYQIRKQDDLELRKNMFEDFCFSFLIHQGFSIREIPSSHKVNFKNADFVAIQMKDNVQIKYLVKCEWDNNYPIKEDNNLTKMNNHITQTIASLGTILTLDNPFNHILITNADAQDYHKELAKNYQIQLYDFSKIEEIIKNKG